MKANASEQSSEVVSPSSSVVTRTLTLPEIVINIFSQCSAGESAPLLTVCRLWSEVGSDRVWRDLKSIFPLLKLLAPLEKVGPSDGTYYWGFARPITRHDWKRFHHYANRVRRIEFDCEERIDGVKAHLPSGLMESAAGSHYCDDTLFPKMEALVWKGNSDATARAIMPFISHNLGDLTLSCGPEISSPAIAQILHCAADRAIALRCLYLKTVLPAVFLEKALVDFFNTQKNLRKIVLPEFYQTEEMVSAVGELQQLTYFGITWEYRPPHASNGMCFAFGHQKYPSLVELHCAAPPSRASRLLSESPQTAALISVTLSYHLPTTPYDTNSFLSTLARHCPKLEEAALSLHAAEATALTSDPLTFDTIRPLLQCKLVLLYINYGHAFILSPEDVAEMGKAWPNMKNLELCEDSHVHTLMDNSPMRGNDFTILLHLARHLPNLECLCLYFDSNFDRAQLDAACRQDGAKFQALTELGVGLSPAPADRLALGAFIANISTQPITIFWGTSYWYFGPDVDDDREEVAWREVQDAFIVVHRSIEIAITAIKKKGSV